LKDDKEKLEKILECIDRVNKYTKEGREEFFRNHLIQDGVVRNIQVIGEAIKELSPELKEQNQDVPWSKAARMRDQVTHRYFDVDYKVVWDTVEHSLPPFRERVEDIHQRLVYRVPENRETPSLDQRLKEQEQERKPDVPAKLGKLFGKREERPDPEQEQREKRELDDRER
jgi:uncharacterized protein with HEPN domain